MKEKKSLIQWFGLLGVISFVSYVAAVVFAPLAYPGYDWMSQAVSDLSAVNAPSKMLWTQLSALYDTCAIVSVTVFVIYIQGKLNKCVRVGIYLFAIMNWVTAVGYQMFPLSDVENLGSVQDICHLIVTVLVVVLSIASLVVIMVGGYRKKQFVSLAVFATIALVLMFIGAMGTNMVPKEYFGIVERFSVMSATGFNAVLGIYQFRGISD